MKFAIVLVILGLALGAQSSLVPWPVVWPGPLSYTAVHSPPSIVLQHPLSPHVVVAGGSTVVAGAPSIVAAAAPAVVAAAAPAVVVAAPVTGTYVAKTRGAVHVAPLPGHLNSASSVNLQPAPGTI